MIDNKSSISTFIEEGAAYPHTYSIEEFAEELTHVEQLYFSQWNGLFQDTLSDTLPQSSFCHDIYFMTEQILQIHQKSPKVEEATPRLKIH